MDRQIPLFFDSVVIDDSSLPQISNANPNLSRLKVRVFTKYGNRNGSYITETVANQLIESATNRITPVVGFFDPATHQWASHAGPELSKAYGYVEDFLGWEPFMDTDGVTREYAVFSVILFVDYFQEAKNIIGQKQSMELNPESITGNWAVINGIEYFIYTAAKMQGFCIIGENEPCFSVSSFYSLDGVDLNNNNNNLDDNSQFAMLSSLLFSLKTQVEEIEKINKGGGKKMDIVENVQETEVVETEAVVEEVAPATFENEQEQVEEQVVEETSTIEEPVAVEEEIVITEPEVFEKAATEDVVGESAPEAVVTYSAEAYNELQSELAELTTTHSQTMQEFMALTQENVTLKEANATLSAKITEYEQKMAEVALEKKNILIEKYEKILSAEEIEKIREKINDFTYDELESKLAISFANSKMNNVDTERVLIPEQPDQFALLMKKYRIK